MIAIIAEPGSSPLARGLREPLIWKDEPAGIIPARAGFTWIDFVTSLARDGSSPLARGLLEIGQAAVGDLRIIPARAGFTRSRAGSRREARDHPRSRGVYRQGTGPSWRREGSSPLARGLP